MTTTSSLMSTMRRLKFTSRSAFFLLSIKKEKKGKIQRAIDKASSETKVPCLQALMTHLVIYSLTLSLSISVITHSVTR